MDKLKSSLHKLQDYIEQNNYKGYDPYDLLKSPLFNLPFLKSNKTIRFYFQQLGKRFPINLRLLFRVPKGYNPVTLGLSIQAYTYLSEAFPTKKEQYKQKIEFLIDELETLIPNGFSGACWGYDFYWQARNADIPGYQPTVVATGIITNALFIYYKFSGNSKALELLLSSTNFIVNDLHITESDNGICFSYSPFDKQVVFNASMKAVRLLSQAYSINKDIELKELSDSAVKFVMRHQRDDGAWVYSDKLNNRIDNYHTGYVISCLKDHIELTGNNKYSANLSKGFEFYKNNFIELNGVPKFYHNEMYPVDCTAASQLILTLTDFNETELTGKIAKYMLVNMFDDEGYFYFRKFRFYTIKTTYMRWSQAWMFAALSKYNLANIKL